MQVRIYKPAKTAMQSGMNNNKEWVLESEPTPKVLDPLMGWTGSRDTMEQVQLRFPTLDEARIAGIPVTTITETLIPAGASFQDWQVTQLAALKQALAQATGR